MKRSNFVQVSRNIDQIKDVKAGFDPEQTRRIRRWWGGGLPSSGKGFVLVNYISGDMI